MTFEPRKAIVVSSWMLVVAITSIVLGIDTPAGWGLMITIAVIPALVAMRLWMAPLATMSQRIHADRR